MFVSWSMNVIFGFENETIEPFKTSYGMFSMSDRFNDLWYNICNVRLIWDNLYKGWFFWVAIVKVHYCFLRTLFWYWPIYYLIFFFIRCIFNARYILMMFCMPINMSILRMHILNYMRVFDSLHIYFELCDSV